MVTFQLFVLECYKVQETLQKMCVEKNEELLVKHENSTIQIDEHVPVIKSEVKTFLSYSTYLGNKGRPLRSCGTQQSSCNCNCSTYLKYYLV